MEVILSILRKLQGWKKERDGKLMVLILKYYETRTFRDICFFFWIFIEVRGKIKREILRNTPHLAQ